MRWVAKLKNYPLGYRFHSKTYFKIVLLLTRSKNLEVPGTHVCPGIWAKIKLFLEKQDLSSFLQRENS